MLKRLIVVCEGQTEQAFADQMLFDFFIQRNILLEAKLVGKLNHRGGASSYGRVRNDIHLLLKQQQSAVITTMLDLYKISTDFPRLQESKKLIHLSEERVLFLEEKFQTDILKTLDNDSLPSRFIPYLQLHEFEANLFSETKAFKKEFPNDDDKISMLQGIVEGFESPERINDKPEKAPSNRIIKIFPEYRRGKVKFGPSIAQEIGLVKIREKCPHFSSWISRLERIGNIL